LLAFAQPGVYVVSISESKEAHVATHNLTEKLVERIKPPAKGEVFYRDRELRGFALRVNWGSVKSFVVEGRINGRVRRITLGRWPVLATVVARREALKMKTDIRAGLDPTVTAAAATTFQALVDRYLEHARLHGKKSWKRDQQALALYIPSGWRTRRLSDIARDEVIHLHDQIGEQHGKYAANRLVSLIRSMFNSAIDDLKLFKGENPAARIKPFREDKRERFLSPDELQRVNEALLQEPNPYWRAYFPLLLLLGPRKTELLTARWADIDLVAHTWLKPMTKNGRSHLLPLSAPAIAIIEALPSRGASEWLFPGRSKTGHLVGPRTPWDQLRQRAGVPGVRIHDLRRTFGSWLAGAGFSLPQIGRALGHSNPSSTAIYARLALDPVRTMLEQNATLMFGGAK
jgi:integrase